MSRRVPRNSQLVAVAITRRVLQFIRTNQKAVHLSPLMEWLYGFPSSQRETVRLLLNQFADTTPRGSPLPPYTYREVCNGIHNFPTFEKWLYAHLLNTKKHDGFVTSQQDDALATRLLDHAAKETIRLDTDNRVHITTDPDSDESDSDDDSEERTDNRVHITTDPDSDESDSDDDSEERTDNRVHITTDPDSDDSEERTMTESVNMGENIKMRECD